MDFESLLFLLSVGIVAGLLSGLFGVGGGVIIVPSLITIYGFLNYQSPYTVHVAIATSLFAIIFTSISSAYRHSKLGNIFFREALIIGISSSFTVFLFTDIALNISGEILQKIFSFFLLVVALIMFFEKEKHLEIEKAADHKTEIKTFSCVLIGILSGIIAALTGLGGGVFVIPLMHYFLKLSFKKCVGTSTLSILITSIAGVIGYLINKPDDSPNFQYSLGLVDLYSSIPIIIASIPFAQLGTYLNKKIHGNLLKKLFAVFVFIVSLRMFLF